MPNNRRKLFIALMGTLVVVGYILLPGAFNNLNFEKKDTGFDDSPFSAVGTPELPDDNDIIVEFQNFFSQTHDSADREVSNPWEDWNWETTMIVAEVTNANYTTKVIDLLVSQPKSLGELKSVYVECTPENTVSFYAENLEELDSNFDLFEDGRIEDAQSIYAYCLDPTCAAIGKSCVLIDKVK